MAGVPAHVSAPCGPWPAQPLEATAGASRVRQQLWPLSNLWPADSSPRGPAPSPGGAAEGASSAPASGLQPQNSLGDSGGSGGSGGSPAAAAAISSSGGSGNGGSPVAASFSSGRGSGGSGGSPAAAAAAFSSGGGTPLGWQQRFTSAAGASVVSAFVVNPLDVVKTRMQAQAASPDVARAMARESEPLLEKWAITSCPSLTPRVSAAAAGDPHLYRGTVDGIRKIVAQEGVLALYRGTSASLLMAVPMVGIYFPLYDALQARLEGSGGAAAPYAPLLAGSAARTAAVLCTSPLELIRTRMQATQHVQLEGAGARGSSMWHHLPTGPDQRVSTRVRTLWTGVGATLARDVPFSAIYWQILEPLRTALLPPDRSTATQSQVITANLVAGSTAGAVAAAATTPLDVVKTRAQLHPGRGASAESAAGIVASLRQIARSGGVRALFIGVGPRAVRAAPACAIVVASYEAIKALYGEQAQAHA